MLAFVLKRLALVVPTFLGITLLVFSLIRLIPGDPVEALSGERGMTPERYQRLIHEFGHDRIARNEADQREDQQRDAEEGRDDEGEPLEKEGEHAGGPGAATGSACPPC